jgi:hypothetical protein
MENEVQMMRVALCPGRVQAWYAVGYREGTRIERIANFPPWLIFRFLFRATFAVAQKIG